jgi:hypothetical protein
MGFEAEYVGDPGVMSFLFVYSLKEVRNAS